MKKRHLFILFAFSLSLCFAQGKDSSAILQLDSTTQGFLLPRMTTEQRDSIVNPAEGLIVFNTTTKQINYYDQSTSLWISTIFEIPNDTAVTILHQGFIYEEITSATGRKWLDRNLGAYRLAESSTDVNAYGDLYQWGRATDGHQLRHSATRDTQATTSNAGHGDYITVAGTPPYNWLTPQNNTLWQGTSGVNNPCPNEYRIPTNAEWSLEIMEFASNDSEGAFDSALKLTTGGLRLHMAGYGIVNSDSAGEYWSSTVDGNNVGYLHFDGGNMSVGFLSNRAYGFSVRCIKN